jgi:hypothetical protein
VIGAQLLTLYHVLNQTMAKIGVVAMSIGIAFWSIGHCMIAGSRAESADWAA